MNRRTAIKTFIAAGLAPSVRLGAGEREWRDRVIIKREDLLSWTFREERYIPSGLGASLIHGYRKLIGTIVFVDGNLGIAASRANSIQFAPNLSGDLSVSHMLQWPTFHAVVLSQGWYGPQGQREFGRVTLTVEATLPDGAPEPSDRASFLNAGKHGIRTWNGESWEVVRPGESGRVGPIRPMRAPEEIP